MLRKRKAMLYIKQDIKDFFKEVCIIFMNQESYG